MKTCNRCGAVKALSEYSPAAEGGRGVQGRCKECLAALGTQRYQADPAAGRRKAREWATANREKVRERKRELYRQNAERERERSARWARENRERLRETERRYYRTSAARRADRIARARAHEARDRSRVLQAHRGLCGICGDPVDPSDFHVDHILPRALGGGNEYANLQPAHPICNLRKGARAA